MKIESEVDSDSDLAMYCASKIIRPNGSVYGISDGLNSWINPLMVGNPFA